MQVEVIPPCDLCGDGTPAKYDARLPGMGWANVCQDHFEQHYCKVGTGNGQELTTEPVVSTKSSNHQRTIASLADELGMPVDEVEMMADDMGFDFS